MQSAYTAKLLPKPWQPCCWLTYMHGPQAGSNLNRTERQALNNLGDEFNLMYYAAPDASNAWALPKALLANVPEGHSDQPRASLEPFMLDVCGVHSSKGELAQPATCNAQLEFMKTSESKLSMAACMLKQVLICKISVQVSHLGQYPLTSMFESSLGA